MPIINFSNPPWNPQPPNPPIPQQCGGQVAGTYTDQVTDPQTQVSFIIASGKMSLVNFGANRMLFFTTVDCSNTVQPSTVLVIRFSTPQPRITFRLSFDEHGVAPTLVQFFKDQGNPQQTPLSEVRLTAPAVFNDVVFDRCCFPAREVIIRSDRPENSLDDLFWGPSQTSHTIRIGGREFKFRCLCVMERIRVILSALLKSRPPFGA
ncbi:MAG TPA: hypothetical protein PLZ79_12035 [Burkholderiales bacterium]|nr:hypothetical protein [Burkholderiales bacterium]